MEKGVKEVNIRKDCSKGRMSVKDEDTKGMIPC
jgi:hypothetical protein